MPDARGERCGGLRVSAVDDRDRVDLDEVLGPGQCLYPDNRVGWLVIAEQRRPGLFDHWQVLRPVVSHVDSDLGDLLGMGTGSGERAAKVGEHLMGLGCQVTRADEVALGVLGFLASDEHRLGSGSRR